MSQLPVDVPISASNVKSAIEAVLAEIVVRNDTGFVLAEYTVDVGKDGAHVKLVFAIEDAPVDAG